MYSGNITLSTDADIDNTKLLLSAVTAGSDDVARCIDTAFTNGRPDVEARVVVDGVNQSEPVLHYAAFKARDKFIDSFLGSSHLTPTEVSLITNYVDGRNYTALHHPISNMGGETPNIAENIATVKALMRHGTRANGRCATPPRSDSDPATSPIPECATPRSPPIYAAIEACQLETVQTLMNVEESPELEAAAAHGNLLYRNSTGVMSPLLLAAASKATCKNANTIIRSLCGIDEHHNRLSWSSTRGANPDIALKIGSYDKMYPMMYAILLNFSSSQTVEALQLCGADPELRVADLTPLHVAAINGNSDLINQLLNPPASAARPSNPCATGPMMHADAVADEFNLLAGDMLPLFETSYTLARSTLDTAARGCYDSCPLATIGTVAPGFDVTLTKMLLGAPRAETLFPVENAIHPASCMLRALRGSIPANANLQPVYPDVTALLDGRTFISQLMDMKDPRSIAFTLGWLLRFISAATTKRPEMKLAEKVASVVNRLDNTGQTADHRAMKHAIRAYDEDPDNFEAWGDVFAKLHSLPGFSASVLNADGYTALQTACLVEGTYAGYAAVLYLHKFADTGVSVDNGINTLSRGGETAVTLAARHTRQGILQAIIDTTVLTTNHHPDFDLAGDGGLTPLVAAAHLNHTVAISALIKSGASVNTKDPSGMSPLGAACLAESWGAINILLKNKAKPCERFPNSRKIIAHSVAFPDLITAAAAECPVPSKVLRWKIAGGVAISVFIITVAVVVTLIAMSVKRSHQNKLRIINSQMGRPGVRLNH